MQTSVEEKTITIDWRVLTDAEIVEDDLQTELIQWRDVFRVGQFRIGDIALETIEKASSRGIVIPDYRVDEAVSRYSGKSPRTVRYYREAAAFYPVEVRQEFEILPFSHFVFARTLGDRWHEVLQFSSEQPGITEGALKFAFLGGIGILAGESPQSSAEEEGETPNDPPENSQNNICEVSHGIPDRAMRHVKLSALNAVASSMDTFCKAVQESRVSDDLKSTLIDAAQIIRKHLPEVLRSMV